MKLFFSGPVLLHFAILFQIFCPPMQAYTSSHPRQHATHARYARTPPMLPILARHTSKHTSHATHASTPPMQARHACKRVTYINNASTNSTPFLKFFFAYIPQNKCSQNFLKTPRMHLGLIIDSLKYSCWAPICNFIK